MVKINVETKDYVKQKKVEAIIDYMNETVYLSDIEIEEADDYINFFAELYDFFENKNIAKYYFEILSAYILRCTFLVSVLNIKELKNYLDLLIEFNKIIVDGDKINKQEIKELKSNKTKTLTSN